MALPILGYGVTDFPVACPNCGSSVVHFSIVPEVVDGVRGLTGHVKCWECEFEPPYEESEFQAEDWLQAFAFSQDYWIRGAGLDPDDFEIRNDFVGLSEFCEGVYGSLAEYRMRNCASH